MFRRRLKPLLKRIIRRRQRIREILQQILLLFRQRDRSFHLNFDQLISFSAAFQSGKTAPFDPERRSALRPFGNFHAHFAGHGGNIYDPAADSGRKRNRQFANQVQTVPFEYGMRQQPDDHIKIARRSTLNTCFPFFGNPQLGTVVNTRGNMNFEIPRSLNAPLTAARTARSFYNLSASAALRARLRHSENALHLPASVTLRTGGLPRRRVRSASAADCTRSLFGKTELLTSPEDEGRAYLIPIDPIDLPLIPIERGSTLIGKLSAAADVILPYRTVSRLHAKLVSTEEGDYLLDLNSRNGTTVNGVPLMGETKKKLEDGDDISFAGKKYRYKAGEKNRN